MKNSPVVDDYPVMSPLELDSKLVREISGYVTEKIIAYLDSLPQQPVSDLEGADQLIADLTEALPESGEAFRNLIDRIFDQAVTKGYNSASPGYMAFIPGGGLIHSGFADLIGDAINRYVGVWVSAPGLVQIETNVIRWFCEMVGFPERAGGFLTTGGSLANFSALFTARRMKLPENFLSGIVYTSDQSHHSVMKAAILAGFPEANIRIIRTDPAFRIDIDLMMDQIRKDRREGLTPFAIVANAGSTNTGAVDDLDAIADLSERENLWLHVDAAYGGFFMLTMRGRQSLYGLDRADSITLDPHKGLFLPYGTGCLLVREQDALKKAHEIHAGYLPPMQDDPRRPDFCQISPELSRDFRGLRVWLPIKMHGIRAFRKTLEEKLDLVHWITERLESIEQLEIVARPQLSIVTFKVRSPGNDTQRSNDRTRALLERINSYRRVLLTGTWLEGIFVIRICVLSFRTHREQVQNCLNDIERACGEMDGNSEK
ncbi:MAG: aminotransferase class V-fold PLP-dependent enzyme [Methylococcaceae bacterium]|nr:aminotransferase class V-fold PLP-dependent enzyme [Methylococcaceae bacterium]